MSIRVSKLYLVIANKKIITTIAYFYKLTVADLYFVTRCCVRVF